MEIQDGWTEGEISNIRTCDRKPADASTILVFAMTVIGYRATTEINGDTIKITPKVGCETALLKASLEMALLRGDYTFDALFI